MTGDDTALVPPWVLRAAVAASAGPVPFDRDDPDGYLNQNRAKMQEF